MEYGLQEYSFHSFHEIEFSQCPKEISVENACNKRLSKNTKISLFKKRGKRKNFVKRRRRDRSQLPWEKEIIGSCDKRGEVGELHYKVDGKVWYKEDILAAETKKKIDFPWCLKQVVKRYGNVEKN